MNAELLSINIHTEVDNAADTSWLGRYTNIKDDWNICRCCGEYIIDLPKTHVSNTLRNEYKYFKPYAGGVFVNSTLYRNYGKQDFKRMEELSNGYWEFIGIYASAKVKIYNNSKTKYTIHKFRSAGIWGIESDLDKEHFRDIVNEELAYLKNELVSYNVDMAIWDTEVCKAESSSDLYS